MSLNLDSLSYRNASRGVGIGLVTMFFLSIVAILFILQSIIVPDDTSATLVNINANPMQFYTGVVLYFIILLLDAIVAIALYIVLKPVNKYLALLTTALRLLYTTSMVISLILLLLQNISAYDNFKLVAYFFSLPISLFSGILSSDQIIFPKLLEYS